MPLSEEELRLLEQMERALVAEDPKLASTLRGTKARRHQRRQVVLGAAGFLVGVAVLMSGAVLSKVYLGVIGFVIMLAAATYTLTMLRGRSAATGEAPAAGEADPTAGLRVIQGGKTRRRRPGRAASGPAPSGSMMDRFEERWRRRRERGV